ncbi:hypothetical protein LZ30DRAFT_690465 [Colletotrichum cereale]|nr:hypothetical protein LZ30DRAFT_690465 [Colletotrichum cereale]
MPSNANEAMFASADGGLKKDGALLLNKRGSVGGCSAKACGGLTRHRNGRRWCCCRRSRGNGWCGEALAPVRGSSVLVMADGVGEQVVLGMSGLGLAWPGMVRVYGGRWAVDRKELESAEKASDKKEVYVCLPPAFVQEHTPQLNSGKERKGKERASEEQQPHPDPFFSALTNAPSLSIPTASKTFLANPTSRNHVSYGFGFRYDRSTTAASGALPRHNDADLTELRAPGPPE